MITSFLQVTIIFKADVDVSRNGNRPAQTHSGPDEAVHATALLLQERQHQVRKASRIVNIS